MNFDTKYSKSGKSRIQTDSQQDYIYHPKQYGTEEIISIKNITPSGTIIVTLLLISSDRHILLSEIQFSQL